MIRSQERTAGYTSMQAILNMDVDDHGEFTVVRETASVVHGGGAAHVALEQERMALLHAFMWLLEAGLRKRHAEQERMLHRQKRDMELGLRKDHARTQSKLKQNH